MQNQSNIILSNPQLILPNNDLKKTLDKFEFKDLFENAWLDLHVNESTLPNPLTEIPEVCQDRPELYIMWLMTRPEYFYLTCKVLLNVNILPFQGVILDQLWNHKFPMLIGSRGMSKSFMMAIYVILRLMFIPNRKIVIAGAGFRQSKVVFQYIETIVNNSPILKDYLKANNGKDSFRKGTDEWRVDIGSSNAIAIPIGCVSPDTLITTGEGIREIIDLRTNDDSNLIYGNGKFRQQGFFFDSGICESFNVKTKAGFEFTATPNHKMKIVRDSNIIWCRTDELKIGDRVLIDRTKRWFASDTEVSEMDAYCLGLMIGDGCYTKPNKFRYTSCDPELHNAIQHIGPFKLNKDNLHADMTKSSFSKEWHDLWNLGCDYGHQKYLPKKILSSSKEKMRACLQGLFDTDGHVSILSRDNEPSGIVGYTTTSIKLVKQLQYILTHFGIISSVSYRDRKSCRTGNDCKRCYNLLIGGNNIELFYNEIGFRLNRKQDVLEEFLNQRIRKYSYTDNIPIDFKLVPKSLTHSRKTLTFDRAIQNNFQHELVNKDFYYDTITNVDKSINQQMYDINIPEGNEYCANGFFSHNTGDKLRGKRANDIFCDEFASMLIDIFETVIAGFGAVSSAPEKNVKRIAAEKLAKRMGMKLSELENFIEPSKTVDNQIVISGTAYYDFNHFSKYHDKWKAIIKTRGNRNKLKELIGNEELNESFKAEDYSIIRIPYELIPEGFMDSAQVSRSRATMHSGNYEMEFGAIFSKDSMGFFKRTLVESCVVKDDEVIVSINGNSYSPEKIFFEPMMYGDKRKTYVMGIDPAIAADNFAIVILEIDPPFRKVVHCWVTNKKDHTEKVKLGLTSEHNYYAYAARKVRELAKQFPCVRIAIDSEGGGRAILESLKDKDKLRAGEVPIYHIINPDKPNYEEDGETGLHIVDEISFSNGTWVSDANHGMKKDMEDGILLFPFVDSISFAEADYEDEEASRHYDTLQQNIRDIEEIKNELITIVVTESKTGREGFDTPEIKTGTGRKGRMKKDRYSALLMANMTGRQMMNSIEIDLTMSAGGFANFGGKKSDTSGKLFSGPSFISDKLSALYQ